MLPLSAEFKRAIAYRITPEGQLALHLAGMSGSSARSRKTPEDQVIEFRVLDYLAEREMVKEESLRAGTRASKSLLAGMVRKKWIAREDLSEARDAARTVRVAVLRNRKGNCNTNQKALIDVLLQPAARFPLSLQGLELPRSTLGTLVKRGLIEIVEESAELPVPTMQARPSPFDFDFSSPQQRALERIRRA